MLLVCFDGRKSASEARRAVEAHLRSHGNEVLDAVVGEVNAKHVAKVHDPPTGHVVSQGRSSFGQASWQGLLSRAHLGSVRTTLWQWSWGSPHLRCRRRCVWRRVGVRRRARPDEDSAHPDRRLPAAGVISAPDLRGHERPGELARGSCESSAAVASAAVTRDDLTTQVLARPGEPAESGATKVTSDRPIVLSMITVRYPDPVTAGQIAKRMAAAGQTPNAPQIELVLSADRDGHRHVTDPSHGAGFIARSNVVSWGTFGLIFGAIAGGVGGGILNLLGNAILTGVGWGLFDRVAGLSYGWWAG